MTRPTNEANSGWPTAGHDTNNSGYVPGATGPKQNVSARWVLEVDETARQGDVVVSDGTVYVAGDSGVRAVDDVTGEVIWNTTAFSTTELVLAGDTLYVAGEWSYSQSVIIALDATDGSERWNVTGGYDEYESLRVADGMLFAENDDYVRAYDADTGQQLWYESFSSVTPGGIAVSSDTVYLPVLINSNGPFSALVALNATDGTERWRFEMDGEIHMTPTVANGTVYIGKGDEGTIYAPDPRLYALDTEDGSIEWAYDAHATTRGVAVAEGTVFAATGNTMRALDEATGEERWTFTGDGNDYYGAVLYPPAVADGVVYVSDNRGYVYGLAAETGTQRWRYDIGGVPGSPAVADDTLYVRAHYSAGTSREWEGSRIYALEEDPFAFSGLSTSASTVTPGESVTVDVTIENTDTRTRAYNVSLIDDRPHVGGELAKANESGSLAPDESVTLSLTTSFNVTGDHDLSIRHALDPESAIGPVTVSVAHANPNREWSTKNFNGAGSNTNPTGVGAKGALQEVWNASGGHYPGYQPVVVNGTTYIVDRETHDDRNVLRAFDEVTGEERWSYNFTAHDKRLAGSAAATDEMVYVTTFPGYYHDTPVGSNATIYGFNANGTMKWTKTLAIDNGYGGSGSSGDHAPIVVDDTVYVAGSLEEDETVDPIYTDHDARFYALDGDTGAIKWTYDYGTEDEDEYANRFAIGETHAFIQIRDDDSDGSTTYGLHAVDLTTHNADWIAGDIDPATDPLVGDGFVYVASHAEYRGEERLYAYNVSTGVKAWQLDKPTGNYYGSEMDNLALSDGRLYVDQAYRTDTYRHDRLYVLDPVSGQILWNKSIADANNMAIVDGLLYAGGYDFSETYVYDATTGELLGDSDNGAMLSVANGTMYTYYSTAPSRYNRLMALREGGKIAFSDMQVSTNSARIRENVTVTATATNVGTWTRSFQTRLDISGSYDDHHVYGGTSPNTVHTLAPGESTTISYVVDFRTRGDHIVRIAPDYHWNYGGSPTQDTVDQYMYDTAENVTVSVGDDHDGKTVTLSNRTMAVTSTSWPTGGLDANNSAYHEATTGPTAVDSRQNVVSWNNTDSSYGWTTPPTVANGTVYVGSDSQLHAINETDGSIDWQYAARDDLISAPTYADGFVYVGGEYGRLYAMNATTGRMLWSFYAGDVQGSPTVVDGVIYFGTSHYDDPRVYALNASTRDVLWSFSTADRVETSPAVVDDTVYVSTSSGDVHVLDAMTGEQQWNTSIADGYESTSPVVDGNMVYVGNNEELAALDVVNEQLVWNVSADLRGDETDYPTKPALADGTLYVGDDTGHFRAINATDGTEEWSRMFCSAIDGSPAVVGDVVYFGANDGYVYALDTATGDDVWNFEAISGDTSYPVVYAPSVVDGVAYVATDGGANSLYALTGGTSSEYVHPLSISGLTVSPANTSVGTEITISATVANAGASSCDYPAQLYVDGTEVDSTSVSVSDGSSSTVDFTHTFDSPGAYDVTINDLEPVTVNVSGPEPDVAVTPTSYDFGEADVDSMPSTLITVHNDGAADLDLLGAAITGANASSFYVSSNPFGYYDYVWPGGSRSFYVYFTPTESGTKTATLEVYTNDTDEGTFEVPLAGTGTVDAPQADVSPSSIDFGTVTNGAIATENMTVTNVGGSTLTFDHVTVTSEFGGFSATAGNVTTTLEPGETHGVAIEFAPTTAGTDSGTVVVHTDDPNNGALSVPVGGTAVDPQPELLVEPGALEFGSVENGSRDSKNLTIRNVGERPLSVDEITVVDDQRDVFTVSAATTSFTLAPGESSNVTVTFAPTNTEANQGTLRIVSNDTQQPAADIGLYGSGTRPPGVYYDYHIESQSVRAGEDLPLLVSVMNDQAQADVFNATIVVDGNTDATWNGTLNAGEYTSKAFSLSLSPGEHEVTVNDLEPTTVTVVSDGGKESGPTIAVTDVTGGRTTGATVYANETVSIAGTASADGNVSLVRFALISEQTTFIHIGNATYDAATGTWMATVDLGDIPDDGRYRVMAAAFDATGNFNETIATQSVVVDRHSPRFGATITRIDGTTARVNVTASERLLDGSLDVTVQSPTDDSTSVPMTDAGEHWTGTVAISDDGQYVVTATGADVTGNRGSDTATATFQTVSTENRTVTVLFEPSGTFIRFNTTADVTDSFVTVTESDAPLAPLGPERVGAHFLNGQLGPSLTDNLSSATIGIPVNESRLPAGLTAAAFEVGYYNPATDEWEAQPTQIQEVELEDGTTGLYWVTTVDHFSTYGAVSNDTTAPTITGMEPTDGHTYPAGTTNATLAVDYDDIESGVNVSAVTVHYDGVDVTDSGATQITSAGVTYQADGFIDGSAHSLSVTVADHAGNTVTETLSFTVETPATFTVSNVALNRTAIETDEAVRVSADVTNDGETDGTYTAVLLVDGTSLEQTDVTVASGATESVTFTPTFSTAGEYDLAIGSVPAGAVTVTAPTVPTSTETEPEPTTTETETETETETPTKTETETETESETTTPSTTESPSPTEPPTATSTETETGTTEVFEGQPGFGIGAALFALVVTIVLGRRRRR